jgi:hypothetical protein
MVSNIWEQDALTQAFKLGYQLEAARDEFLSKAATATKVAELCDAHDFAACVAVNNFIISFKRSIEMEISTELNDLRNTFKVRTDVTFTLANEDGSLREETYRVLHWPPADHRAPDGTTLLGQLFAAEMDTDNPLPIITRQLRLLEVYCEGLTVGGKPLNTTKRFGLSDEELAQIPLSVQQKIVADICAPVLQAMNRRKGEQEDAQSNLEPATTGSAAASPTTDSAA